MFAFAGTWNSNLNKIPEDFNIPDRSSAAAKDSKLMVSQLMALYASEWI